MLSGIVNSDLLRFPGVNRGRLQYAAHITHPSQWAGQPGTTSNFEGPIFRMTFRIWGIREGIHCRSANPKAGLAPGSTSSDSLPLPYVTPNDLIKTLSFQMVAHRPESRSHQCVVGMGIGVGKRVTRE
jgi:hypothetical protein